MPSAGQRALQKALEQGSFEPTYYFHGDEDFLKEKAMRRLVDRAVDPATRDFNLDVRSGADVEAEDLASVLVTPPMLAERRVVVIRDAGALRKDVRAVLDRHLETPAPEVVLVLVAAAGGKADRALAKRCTEVEFAALSPQLIPKWIVRHAESEMNVAITPPAAELLHRCVGGELPQIVSELDKLASYTGGATIDEAAVQAVVGVRSGETLGDLLDGIAVRDARTALRLLPNVLSQPKTSAVGIVMALAVQTLAIAWARARIDAGASSARLESDFIALLRDTGAYPFRPWGDAARVWARAVDLWTSAELDRAIDTLLAADAALKETRLSSDEHLLATLVLALCRDVQSAAA